MKLTPSKIKFLKEFFLSHKMMEDFFTSDDNQMEFHSMLHFLEQYEEGKHCPLTLANAAQVVHEWDERCELSDLVSHLDIEEDEQKHIGYHNSVRQNKELLGELIGNYRLDTYSPDEILNIIKDFIS